MSHNFDKYNNNGTSFEDIIERKTKNIFLINRDTTLTSYHKKHIMESYNVDIPISKIYDFEINVTVPGNSQTLLLSYSNPLVNSTEEILNNIVTLITAEFAPPTKILGLILTNDNKVQIKAISGITNIGLSYSDFFKVLGFDISQFDNNNNINLISNSEIKALNTINITSPCKDKIRLCSI